MSILYSLAIVVANGLVPQGFLPAYLMCMGRSSTDYKAIVYIFIILPVILMVLITFWYDWRTKQLINSFRESPEYSDLRECKDISLLVTMGEESTHRATIVNICIVIVSMVFMLSFSSAISLSQVEKILFPAAILLLLKEPLIVTWVSTVSNANFKRIEKEHLAVVYKKSTEEHHEIQVVGNNFYEDQLAHNINFEPVAGM